MERYKRQVARRLVAPTAVLGLAAFGGFLAHQDESADPAAGMALTPLVTEDAGGSAPFAFAAPMDDSRYDDDVTIRRGDTFISALVRAGVDHLDASAAVEAIRPYFNPRKLQVGQTISLHFEPGDNAEPQLAKLALQEDVERTIALTRTDDGWSAAVEKVPLVRVTMRSAGEIKDSLYLSAARENVPAPVIADLIRIFSYDVDFQREVRKGDKFEVYFDRQVAPDGSKAKEGNILFARLTLSGKPITLYRFDDGEDTDYFHEDGHSAKRSLLRTPVDGARLTSGFGYRKHPILGYNKLHKGIDFGAASGTPVMAAGDGVVERASVFGGYGKYVRIRHTNAYSTAYAHMSAYGKGIKAGVRVKQGQIIGYVGTTGRSTGPHLHYEVMANNKQVNPLNLKLPTGKVLKGNALTAFNAFRSKLDTEIAAIPLPYDVAALKQ